MSTDLIPNFAEFIHILVEEHERLKKAGSFIGIRELPGIIKRVEEMKDGEFIPRIKDSTDLDTTEINLEICQILDPYFQSFSKDGALLRNIRSATGEFFALEKAYQLSHARGVWRAKLDENESLSPDIQHYFLARIFIDYYESLVLVLRPVLKFHWKAAQKKEDFPFRTSAQYGFLSEIFPNSSFKLININTDFKWVRNQLSHGKLLFKENSISVWKLGKKPKKLSYLEIFPLMKTMLDLVVIYTTEIDLRILRLAAPGKDYLFKNWMEYFDNYVHWFLKNYKDKTSKP